jgi:nucleoid DNA-binding protein
MSDDLNRVTRHDLLEAIIATTGVRRADALKCMNATFRLVAEALEEGRSVSIRGFGTFEMRHTPARQRTDPHSGQIIDVPAGTKPRLRLSPSVRR